MSITARADVRERYQVTVPNEVRKALHLAPGDLLEFVIEKGRVLVQGLRPIPTDQAWYWTPDWQSKEREADSDIAAGRTTFFSSDDEFDNWLAEN